MGIVACVKLVPPYIRFVRATRSKYLVGALKFTPNILTANMKFYSAEAVRVVLVGAGDLVIEEEVVMAVLLRVSMIILAKPTMITMIIESERIPPVVVLY
jgi:hypothetical protein